MRVQNLTTLSMLGAAALMAGCAAPSVRYFDIEAKPNADVADIYALNSAKITITSVVPKHAVPPPDPAAVDKSKENKSPQPETPAAATTLTVGVSVVADEKKRIGVDPTKNVWSSTKVNIEKIPNSDRVATIGVETTDNAKAFITTVGGLFVQAISAGVAVFAPNPPPNCAFTPASGSTSFTLPGRTVVAADTDFSDLKSDNKKSCISIKYGAAPPQAIESKNIPWETKSEHYYYSACREVEVKVEVPNGDPISEKFRVPDSNLVQKVAFPYKGSIAMHSVCGVSVTTTAQANPMAPYEFAAELLKQAELIRKANDGK
ncbi:MAG: hypothetical protein Q8N13_15485 [Acidovorax sp.]|nr:hypothetical protein [Acidovorax sp.]